MHLKFGHIRFPATVRFVLQLQILLLVIQIGLNSPVQKVNEKLVLRQKRDQDQVANPSNFLATDDETIDELRKLPNALAKDSDLSPQQKNEPNKPYKIAPGGLPDATQRVILKSNKITAKQYKKLNADKWKKRLQKKDKAHNDKMARRQQERWKKAQEEEKVQNGFARHISRVPPPKHPVYDDEAPEGLASDQNKHADDDDEYEQTFSSQREAFETMLDEHRKHPKRSKEVLGESYIVLTYDYKNKKYSIVEIEDEDK